MAQGAQDLPENVAAELLREGVSMHQANIERLRTGATQAHNLLLLGSSQRFNEVGPIESRAVSGLIATPVASPTTQQG